MAGAEAVCYSAAGEFPVQQQAVNVRARRKISCTENEMVVKSE